jgi:hypothetical protein
MLAWVEAPAGEPNGASRSLSCGLTVLWVFHGRIRSGEYERLVPVVAAHQVRRRTARSPNFDDLRRLVGRADNPAVYVKPVTYHRVHGHPPQESDFKNARSGTFCGRGTSHPNRAHRGSAAAFSHSPTASKHVTTAHRRLW